MTDLELNTTPINNPGNDIQYNPVLGNYGETSTTSSIEQPDLNRIQTENISSQVDKPSIVAESSSQSLGDSINASKSISNTNSANTNNQNHETYINDTQKEKLLSLLKLEQSRGQKVGFTRGILSGVALTLCIVIVSAIFAKNQIIDLLSSDKLNFFNLNANVVSLTDDINEETIVKEEVTPDETIVNEEINSDETIIEEKITPDEAIVEEEVAPDEAIVNEEINSDEVITEEEVTPDESIIGDEVTPDESVVEEEVTPDEVTIGDEVTPDEVITEDEVTPDESIIEEEITPDEVIAEEEITPDESIIEDEVTPDEAIVEEVEDADIIEEGYTLKYVDSPEEANWVLSPKCDDVFCNKDKNSITMCNEFRLYENLSDDAPRIGSSGICRYKDTSELVYIKLK